MAANDLITLAEAKAWLGDLATNQQDALLSGLITAASEFICSWTGRPSFLTATATEKYNGNDAMVLGLRRYPITAVSMLTVNGAVVLAAVGQGAGYVFDERFLYLQQAAIPLGFSIVPRFPKGFQNVIVTYTAGYAAIPANVKQACKELVANKFKVERENVGLSSKTLAGETISFDERDLRREIIEMLSSYQVTFYQ